jgi:Mg/Co/Ni transporter MgtE
VTLTPQSEVIGRIAGSVIAGFAIVFWGARDGNAGEALKAVMVAGLVANALDALILLHATITGLLNGLGWLQVLINGALAVGFWYFTWGKGRTA